MYVIAIMEKITYSYIVVHKLESSGRENIWADNGLGNSQLDDILTNISNAKKLTIKN
jgi:hypothetical protein